MYRLRRPSPLSEEAKSLRVRKIAEKDGDVIYFDPRKAERNARSVRAFHDLFEEDK